MDKSKSEVHHFRTLVDFKASVFMYDPRMPSGAVSCLIERRPCATKVGTKCRDTGEPYCYVIFARPIRGWRIRDKHWWWWLVRLRHGNKYKDTVWLCQHNEVLSCKLCKFSRNRTKMLSAFRMSLWVIIMKVIVQLNGKQTLYLARNG